MRKLVVIAALCAALPLAAQDQPQGTPPKPAPAPTLEKPGMAAPDAKSEKPAKPASPKPSSKIRKARKARLAETVQSR